ncbi:MAG: hypothetical protein HC945_00965 [Nitrosarchaeum sp.]|nr:hypothetical protein [Nitrosarchaeum sp.]
MSGGKKVKSEKAPVRGSLNATISVSSLKISVTSDDPVRALPELRKLVEAVGSLENDAMLYEDMLGFELKEKLSSEVVENQEIMAIIKNTLNVEEDYLVTKGVLDVIDELDFEKRNKEAVVDQDQLRSCVESIFSSVEVPAVRSAIVHVKGPIGKSQRLMILDTINRRLNYPKLRVMNTDARQEDKVLIEAILFGDFQYERQE